MLFGHVGVKSLMLEQVGGVEGSWCRKYWPDVGVGFEGGWCRQCTSNIGGGHEGNW